MHILNTSRMLALVLVFSTAPVSAESEQSTNQAAQTQVSPIEELNKQKAAQWGLETGEWQRFESLMQGPLGIQSPGIDPLTALGIEARNERERARYAELQVQVETARVTKLLAYQNAYDQAYKRLYPDMLPVTLVNTAEKPQVSPMEVGNRLAVFVTAACEPCNALVKTMQRQDQRFDVYLVGSKGNDDALRAWALKTGIKPERVRSRQITLNHDAGRSAGLGVQNDFPAVLRHAGGKWVRQ